ncbi:chromosome partitioning protein ParA [Microvirga thermotolerans]|uniref:Chromosome partitioning protein ParA n=1 Tax=Microvirga thermotolerans TaxID=2651334 RepID=A0A5P9JTF0_9HYPH|nr:chromosome partitioning protein ParA [Microvirga thermotolerans]QFU15683.1 chromosome partitioning protein ParA [Microvirga thermotolerans]
MSSGWMPFKNRFGKRSEEAAASLPQVSQVSLPQRQADTADAADPARAPSPSKEEPVLVRPNGALDSVGQKNELIRVRFANMLDRLEEIRSLKDDFALLNEPVNELIRAYPQLQSRLLETEAVLRQETDTTAQLRRELAELTNAQARMTDDLSATVSQLRKAETRLREQDSLIEDLRLGLKDKEAVVADLENQLTIETERARSITEENQALRLEAQEADQTVARAERELIEVRERNGLLDHEVKRLQKVAEEQNYRLSSLTNRYAELETQLEATRQRASELETKLMSEQVLRQRLETQLDSECSAHQTDLSALDMKIEGLNSRLAATDKILAHTRDQLRDKNEALRGVERSLKEITIEKNTVERRLEATQQEVERQVAMVNELQRSRIELQERVEMLNKAIAAKDFQIESADNKVASLTERIDQLTKRFEQDRSTLEAANRRLTEELQNEKAERSLIQGALEIARESRIKIQKKYVSLRKKTRLDTAEDDPLLLEEEGMEAESNVRPLKSSDAE